jgi:signal transduction histidine kinase/PAS domain-containing protein
MGNKFLFVDDDDSMKEFGVALSHDIGIVVESKTTSEDALDTIRTASSDYEFVITDHYLGSSSDDGITLCRKILEINHDIAVIIFTGKDENLTQTNRNNAFQAGAMEFLTKPPIEEFPYFLTKIREEIRLLARIRQELQEYDDEQKWLQNTLSASSALISVVDRRYRVHYMNERKKRSTGGKNKGILCWQLFHNYQDKKQHCKTCPISAVLEQGKPDYFSLIYAPVTNGWHYFQSMTAPLTDATGNIPKVDNTPIAAVETQIELSDEALKTINPQERIKAVIDAIWEKFDSVRLFIPRSDQTMELRYGRNSKGDILTEGTFNIASDMWNIYVNHNSSIPILWDKRSFSNNFQTANKETFSKALNIVNLQQWCDLPVKVTNSDILAIISADNSKTNNKLIDDTTLEVLNSCVSEITKIIGNAELQSNAPHNTIDNERIDLRLSLAKNPEEGINLLADEAVKITNATNAHIWYLSEQKLILAGGAGEFWENIEKEISLNKDYLFSVITAKTKQSHLCTDTFYDNNFLKLSNTSESDITTFKDLRSLVSYPITIDEKSEGTPVLGVLSLQSKIPDTFGNNNLDCLAKLARKAVPLLRDLQLYKDIKTSRDRFQQLLNAIGEEVSIIKPDGTITWVNDVKRKLFEEKGEKIDDGTHLCWEVFEDRKIRCEEINCPCKLAEKKRGIINDYIGCAYQIPATEKTKEFPNKHPYQVQVTAAPIFDSNKKIIELIEITRDITEETREKQKLKAIEVLSGYGAVQKTEEEYLNSACEQIKNVTSAQACSIYLWDKKWNRLRLSASTCLKTGDEEYYCFDENSKVWGSFKTGKPFRGSWHHNMQHTRANSFYKSYSDNLKFKPNHIMLFPLFPKDITEKDKGRIKSLGIIEVVNKIIPDRPGYCQEKYRTDSRLMDNGFDEKDDLLLRDLGTQVTIWIHNRHLVNDQKLINSKLEILTKVLASLERARSMDEIHYLALLAFTHHQGLSHNRAFIAKCKSESEKTMVVKNAIGPIGDQQAKIIWEEMEINSQNLTIDVLLDRFNKNGVPENVLWNNCEIDKISLSLNGSFIYDTFQKTSEKIRVFGHLKEDQSNCLKENDHKFLVSLGRPDELAFTLLPISEDLGDIVIVDNIFDGKHIDQNDIYLLKQYAYSFSAAIRRWQLAQNYKNMAGFSAHEIKGQLQSIVSWADLITEKNVDDHFLEKVRGQIIAESQLASEMVNIFLEQIRSEATNWKLNIEKTDIYTIIYEVVKAIRAEAKRTGVQIKWEPDSNSLLLNVDKRGIRIALVNLVRNAIQAIPKTFPEERKKVEITIESDSQNVSIQVTDYGKGLLEKEQTDCFTPFWGKGIGLGLSYSRDIIKNHGGDIAVCSEKDVKTVFTILLPQGV